MKTQIADVVHQIGRPIVAAPQDTPISSLSGLIIDRGLDAVVLVDADQRTVGLVTPRTIVHILARGHCREVKCASPRSVSEPVLKCSVREDISVVLRRMLLDESSVLLIEDQGKPIATVALDRLAEVMMVGTYNPAILELVGATGHEC